MESFKPLLVGVTVCCSSFIAYPMYALTQPIPPEAHQGAKPVGAPRDGQHDFDFETGSWKTHLKRLLHPLTGSTTWVEYDGTTIVRKVWNGRANLVELEADGPKGHIEALSLRLYNPDSHQWSLNFSNSASGTMGTPSIGEFKNGRGEFLDQEMLGARAILVRFVISGITPTFCHFEQAYSDDGGKTWEVNWIADDFRISDAADRSHGHQSHSATGGRRVLGRETGRPQRRFSRASSQAERRPCRS